MLTKTWITLLGLCLAGALTAGCDHITNAIDCHGICQRYADCFDKSYDTGACENRCKGNANSDKDQMSKVEQCNDCIDDKSCSDATFKCAVQCTGIVP
jgi:hypothetical protein